MFVCRKAVLSGAREKGRKGELAQGFFEGLSRGHLLGSQKRRDKLMRQRRTKKWPLGHFGGASERRVQTGCRGVPADPMRRSKDTGNKGGRRIVRVSSPAPQATYRRRGFMEIKRGEPLGHLQSFRRDIVYRSRGLGED